MGMKNRLRLALIGGIAAFFPTLAAQASTTGGVLPWDGPLTIFMKDITGPTAFAISLLAMAACGITLVWGGEINDFTRRIIIVVMIVAFLVSVANFASDLGIAGALV